MLRRLLYLQPGELSRLWPFFGLYFFLFGALTLADGVALAMFVREVGSPNLPSAYAVIALLNLLVMAGYVLGAGRLGSERGVRLIAWRLPHVYAPEDDRGDPGVHPRGADANLEADARASFDGFFRYVWASPLLFWTTITNFLFMACRWALNYEYSTFFGTYF